MITKNLTSIVITMFLLSRYAGAFGEDIQFFTEFDAWQNDVREFTTIDFTGFEIGDEITNQYDDLGVTFPNFNIINGVNKNSLPQDGWGLTAFDEIHIEFDEPRIAAGFHFLSDAGLQLYDNGDLVFTTDSNEGFGSPGNPDNFLGIHSAQKFDEVFIFGGPVGGSPGEPTGVVIDNFYFGPPIPAPGAAAVLALAVVALRRRRRA